MSLSFLKRVSPVVLASAMIGSAAHAGSTLPGFLTCSTYADGTGSCAGSYEGARNSPTSGDSVNFTIDSNGYAYFNASYSGTSYFCFKNLTEGSTEALVWSAAVNHRNYFAVSWNAAGVCNWVFLDNSSAYTGLQ